MGKLCVEKVRHEMRITIVNTSIHRFSLATGTNDFEYHSQAFSSNQHCTVAPSLPILPLQSANPKGCKGLQPSTDSLRQTTERSILKISYKDALHFALLRFSCIVGHEQRRRTQSLNEQVIEDERVEASVKTGRTKCLTYESFDFIRLFSVHQDDFSKDGLFVWRFVWCNSQPGQPGGQGSITLQIPPFQRHDYVTPAWS